MEPNKFEPKLIHIGSLFSKGKKRLLLLKAISPTQYKWFELDNQNETETEIEGTTIRDAIQKARKFWKNDSFQSLNCGFIYTLPERDEHGIDALFQEMHASYSSPNGVFYNDTLGHNCFVQNASLEALALRKEFMQNKRI